MYASPKHFFPVDACINRDPEDKDDLLDKYSFPSFMSQRGRLHASSTQALPDYRVCKDASFDGFCMGTRVSLGHFRTYDSVHLLLEDVISFLDAWKNRSAQSEDAFFRRTNPPPSLTTREAFRNSVLLFKACFNREGSFAMLQKRLELTRKRVVGLMAQGLAQLLPQGLPLEVVQIICRHLMAGKREKPLFEIVDIRVFDGSKEKREMEEECLTDYFCALGDLQRFLMQNLFPLGDKRQRLSPFNLGMQAGILADCRAKEMRAFFRILSLTESNRSLFQFMQATDVDYCAELLGGLWTRVAVVRALPPLDAGTKTWKVGRGPQWSSLDKHLALFSFQHETEGGMTLVVWNLLSRQRLAWLNVETPQTAALQSHGQILLSCQRLAMLTQTSKDEEPSRVRVKQYVLSPDMTDRRLERSDTFFLNLNPAATFEETKYILVRKDEHEQFAVISPQGRETKISTFSPKDGAQIDVISIDRPNLELLDLLDERAIFLSLSNQKFLLYGSVLSYPTLLATISIRGESVSGLSLANFHAVFDPVGDLSDAPADVVAVFREENGSVQCQIHNARHQDAARAHRSYSFTISDNLAEGWSWKDRVGLIKQHLAVVTPGKTTESCKIYSHSSMVKYRKLWLFSMLKLEDGGDFRKLPHVDREEGNSFPHGLLMPGEAFKDYNRQHEAFPSNNVSRHWCLPRKWVRSGGRTLCFVEEDGDGTFGTRMALVGSDFYVDAAIQTSLIREDEKEEVLDGICAEILSQRAVEKEWRRHWEAQI